MSCFSRSQIIEANPDDPAGWLRFNAPVLAEGDEAAAVPESTKAKVGTILLEIPLAEAADLLALCDGPLIEKTRYCVTVAGFVWEIDEFAGDNAGLVVAEIELPNEDTVFTRPDWLGDEVTGDARYYNSSLSKTPYSAWGR